MFKTPMFLIAGTLVLSGCASPQSTAKDAEDAQRSANQESAAAGEQTKRNDDAIQAKAAQDSAQNARDGENRSDAAQGNADQKAAEAAATLDAARLQARNDSEGKLANLEKAFAELKPKLVRKLSKADSTTVVNDLTAKSEAVRKSIGDLSVATADSLEPVKSTIAQRLIDFDQALAEARKRV